MNGGVVELAVIVRAAATTAAAGRDLPESSRNRWSSDARKSPLVWRYTDN